MKLKKRIKKLEKRFNTLCNLLSLTQSKDDVLELKEELRWWEQECRIKNH